MRRSVFTMLLFLTCVGLARAQNVGDTASYRLRKEDSGRTSGARISFDHLLSIYEWNAHFDYAPAVIIPAQWKTGRLDTLQLAASSRFLQDNFITSTSALGYIWADLPTAVENVRPFASVFASSYVTTGLPGTSAARLITKQVDGFGIAGLHYAADDHSFDASAGGGFAHEAQQSISAAGGVLRGTLNAPSQFVGGTTQLSADALVDERFFQEHSERYSNDQANFSVASGLLTQNISTSDSNHAFLGLGLQRRDFFFATDSTDNAVKQERTELSLLLRDSLTYPITTNALRGTVDFEFEPRSITRKSDVSSAALATSTFSALSSLLVPNQVTGLHLAGYGRLDADITRTFSAAARMSYDEKSENVTLISSELSGLDPSLVTKFSETLDEASYSARTTLAGFSMRYAPGPRDSLRMDISERLLNYDTPSQLNTDDHDELISSGILNYDHAFNDLLSSGLGLRATRTHLVYLKADRSAQNDVVQSLALSSYANYFSPDVMATAGGEVFATYTTLDYLDSVPILQGVGNYLLRGLSLTDSVSFSTALWPFAVAGPLMIEEGATLRTSERGSYDVSVFSERRDTRITEVSGSLLVGLSSFQGEAPWRIRAGVRGFILSRYGHNETSLTSAQSFEELERQTRIGPVVLVSLLRANGKGPTLFGSLWYAVIKDETFDIPSVTRTPQLESHLSVQWTF